MRRCHICNKNTSNLKELTVEAGQRYHIKLCNYCFQEAVSNPHFLIDNSEKITKHHKNKKKASSDFLTDLTEQEKNNSEPILYRDKELNRMIQILSRKEKNNPILIGEPGTGKTAIVELLARKISNNEIPRLKDFSLYELNISSLLSGTKYRGEFEEKVNALFNDIDDKSIVFIDEMHMVMGAGAGSEQNIDLANLLKPKLAKGKFRLIGATTLDEFRTIENDPAFSRRVHSVRVKPFNAEQTKLLLRNKKKVYETYHRVVIPDDISDMIVNYSDEYIKDKYFPDKALDIMDEACSIVSIRENTNILDNEENTDNQAVINSLQGLVGEFFDNFPDEVSEKFNSLTEEKSVTLPTIKESDIIKVVEDMSGIPVSVIKSGNFDRLKTLKDELESRIIGQPEAIDSLSRVVKRSMVRLKEKKKPSVLFFAGPTGVGKTESAKILSKSLFGTKNLIRFDMSEFMEKHTISKLIGSPPGYVGYEEEGQLTEQVRRNPYSIILLDEFEKSHQDIAALFLQVFDDGVLTDNKGRKIDFKNTLFILTSNIGTQSKTPLGFGETNSHEKEKNKSINALKNTYAPEFLNRIDEIITFNPLSEKELIKIADLIIKDFKAESQKMGINFSISEEAKRSIVKNSFEASLGARPLKRAIEKEIEDLLVEKVIDGETDISIVLQNNSLTTSN